MKMKLVWMAFLLAGVAQAQEMEMQVELMNRVATDSCRKGDLVSARVVSPAGFQGSVVEGKLTECTSGSGSHGQSVLGIDFDMLRHNGAVIPINSKIKSSINSKGRANIDEDGRVIGRPAPQKRSSGTGGLGRVLGGLAGGRGSQIGGAVDATVDAAERVSTDAPNIRFDPGARFVLAASARSGPALSALALSPAAAAGATAPASASATPVALATTGQTSNPQNAVGSAQPNFTLLKDEFVPGEKTIFYDDFTDMAPGDAPAHFKIRGASPELMSAGEIRQLAYNSKGSMIPNLTTLPKNFTYEVLVKVEPKGRSDSTVNFNTKGKKIMDLWMSMQQDHVDVIATMRAPYSELGRKRVNIDLNQPFKLALWLQNGRLRVYLNGEKHLDFNQVEFPPIDNVEIDTSFLGAGASMGYRMVRFAESTPDFSQVISSSGRYVTHGILFDTDSDKIKPESAAVIKMIARGLETSPALKMCIEGHTDSVGNPDHNMDLSKRRAEAVKTVLVGQFNVDASRLTTQGMGATKPVDSNDTPQGRAQNRRVEFVKQ
jgi:OmpA-OmpF porin, OOP family